MRRHCRFGIQQLALCGLVLLGCTWRGGGCAWAQVPAPVPPDAVSVESLGAVRWTTNPSSFTGPIVQSYMANAGSGKRFDKRLVFLPGGDWNWASATFPMLAGGGITGAGGEAPDLYGTSEDVGQNYQPSVTRLVNHNSNLPDEFMIAVEGHGQRIDNLILQCNTGANRTAILADSANNCSGILVRDRETSPEPPFGPGKLGGDMLGITAFNVGIQLGETTEGNQADELHYNRLVGYHGNTLIKVVNQQSVNNRIGQVHVMGVQTVFDLAGGGVIDVGQVYAGAYAETDTCIVRVGDNVSPNAAVATIGLLRFDGSMPDGQVCDWGAQGDGYLIDIGLLDLSESQNFAGVSIVRGDGRVVIHAAKGLVAQLFETHEVGGKTPMIVVQNAVMYGSENGRNLITPGSTGTCHVILENIVQSTGTGTPTFAVMQTWEDGVLVREQEVFGAMPVVLVHANGQETPFPPAADTDAARGVAALAAKSASAAGETVRVSADLLTTAPLSKDGVNWEFAPGVTITNATTSVFSDGGSAMSYTVQGGNFVLSNLSEAVIQTNHPSSSVTFDSESVRGADVGYIQPCIHVKRGTFNGRFQLVESADYDGLWVGNSSATPGHTGTATLHAERMSCGDNCFEIDGGTLYGHAVNAAAGGAVVQGTASGGTAWASVGRATSIAGYAAQSGQSALHLLSGSFAGSANQSGSGSVTVYGGASYSGSTGTITRGPAWGVTPSDTGLLVVGAANAAAVRNAGGATAGVFGVAAGGTGVGTLTGLVKGNGTSAMTPAVAGTDYVAPDAELTAVAALTSAADRLPYYTGLGGAALATYTAAARALDDDTTTAEQRATLGTGCVVSGSIQVFDATPTDATAYMGVGGAMGFGSFAENQTRTIIATRSGTIKRCYVRVWATGTQGSAETSTISLRVNGSNTTITNSFKTSTPGGEMFSNTAMNLAVAAGDTIALHWQTPTWATNPSGVYMNYSFEIE